VDDHVLDETMNGNPSGAFRGCGVEPLTAKGVEQNSYVSRMRAGSRAEFVEGAHRDR